MSDGIGELPQSEMTAAPGATTLRAALAQGTRSLQDLGIESARLDAELLLCEVSGRPRMEIYLNLDAALSETQACRFRELLTRRRKREPVAYITGKKEFWSLELFITRDVLVPRPETERLVEVAIEFAKEGDGKHNRRILDIGTGSGAIAVALAKELPDARITATDVSLAALEIARKNAQRFDLTKRIDFHHGDLFAAVADSEGFNVIVSNPPYIRSGELDSLAPEVRDWEPLSALDGGKDGLDFYRRLALEAHRYLAGSGSMVVEIGADMAHAVSELFAETGRYSTAAAYRDYAGRDRVLAVNNSRSS